MVIDPLKIKPEDLPMVIVTDDRRGWLGWIIKNHSHGNYNHIMEMLNPGYVVSQDPGGYKEVPIEKYMKDFIFMKFWKYKDITTEQKKKWFGVVRYDLNQPSGYDFLGLIGQLLGLRWIQDSRRRYCSERVAEHLRFVLDFQIPKQPTPSDINALLKTIPSMEVYGYHFLD